jgi:hypothetical protein
MGANPTEFQDLFPMREGEAVAFAYPDGKRVGSFKFL